MTERLYRTHPYLIEFDAEILASAKYQGHPYVVLDRTCFYPTAGGQPHDTGTLNQVPVVDVIEEHEQILHLVAAPLALGSAHGVVDWPRRFDHMQQHSGQHILSQAWLKVADAATVSFHLGAETCTIDLALDQCEDRLVDAVEEAANKVIWNNLLVDTREYTQDELADVALRKLPTVQGLVRVVSIGDYDITACGGTHVRSTGEIGSIHVLGYERRHGQVRIEFVCGRRAMMSHRLSGRVLSQAAESLSIHLSDLPATVTRLVDEAKSQQKVIEELRGQLLEIALPHWLQQAQHIGNWLVVSQVTAYLPAQIREAAQELTKGTAVIALLVSAPPSAQVCFAASADIPVHMGNLLRTIVAPFGGKGGGASTLAQGGGVQDTDLEAMLYKAQQELVAQAKHTQAN